MNMNEAQFYRFMERGGVSGDHIKLLVDFVKSSDPMSLEASLLAMSVVYLGSSSEERRLIIEVAKIKRT